ncbi:glycerophosphodiester phosphodiesterase [Sphingobacteriaceae bacterium WQ 2009]|uniref:Glycerophosphodiester phosphodiesterase n=1 Tax=Rhinopithecimicrobium faecis TaxID=2820698 RepID=A0A8T4HCG0_9SPHI|nr:glycerophosphodiester phosphodiesterase [Sphingobacteriaceae bacterium WQ 2009]
MKKILILASIISLSLGTKDLLAQHKQLIAHRGAWKNTHTPQNSIASLVEAIKLKSYGSEFDVHMTKDNQLVVNHDHDFYGIDIEKATYAELLVKTHPNGEHIPLLKDFLAAGLKQKKTKLILEIKSSRISKERTLEHTEAVYQLVQELKAQKAVEYIAFDYDACKKLVTLNPQVQVQYLSGNIEPKQIKADGLTGIDYHVSIFKKNPTWIKEAQNLGLKVNVWTVNNEVDIKDLLAQKVDFITTDEPELLIRILKK